MVVPGQADAAKTAEYYAVVTSPTVQFMSVRLGAIEVLQVFMLAQSASALPEHSNRQQQRNKQTLEIVKPIKY